MHENISGAKPAAPAGETPAASGSTAMDTAQDGEAAGEGNAEQEEVDGRSVYVGNASIHFSAYRMSVGLRPLCLLMSPCRSITERRPRSYKSISRLAARLTG